MFVFSPRELAARAQRRQWCWGVAARRITTVSRAQAAAPGMRPRKRRTAEAAWGVGEIRAQATPPPAPEEFAAPLVGSREQAVLVRPSRISPRQSGAAGTCSILRGCTARPDRRLRTAVSSADRAESLPRLLGRIIIAAHRVHLCLGVRGPGIAALRSIRVVCRVVYDRERRHLFWYRGLQSAAADPPCSSPQRCSVHATTHARCD